MRSLIGLIILIIVAIIVIPQALYAVDETQHAVVTRFGEIQTVESTPGLKFKVPFIDTANRLDRRVLRVDVPPSGFPDIENQFLDIDAYVRYRIVDPRSFRETLVDEITASNRISNIAVSALREEVGQRVRGQIIGGRLATEAGEVSVVEPILENGVPAREALTRRVRERVDAQVRQQSFGIEIVDVRIKRADFPESIVGSVYTRMRSERQVQADRLRAEGEEQFLTITADVNREVEIIGAEADETADELRGEGEGEAIRLLSAALEQSPELFTFLRSLEAYEAFLGANTTVVLPPGSDLFQFLQSPSGLTVP